MFGSCARLVLLGLLAVVSSGSAQQINPTDLSKHSIEYDLITLTVQTQVEALLPVVKKIDKTDVTSLFATWAGKFQQAATAGKMTVQTNADNLMMFLSSAAAMAPAFAADSKAALSQAPIDFFKFHAFMPAATYDVVEYGIVRSNKSYNTTLLGMVREFMTDSINSAKTADLQEIIDDFISLSEKRAPGFKKTVWTEIDTAYKAVWTNNPTRAPTAPPSTATPAPSKATTTTTPTTTNTTTTNTTTSASSNTTTTPAPTGTTAAPTISPDLYIGEPVPVDEGKSSTTTTTSPKSTPTPTPTPKSGASTTTTTTAVATTLVLFVASALL